MGKWGILSIVAIAVAVVAFWIWLVSQGPSAEPLVKLPPPSIDLPPGSFEFKPSQPKLTPEAEQRKPRVRRLIAGAALAQDDREQRVQGYQNRNRRGRG